MLGGRIVHSMHDKWTFRRRWAETLPSVLGVNGALVVNSEVVGFCLFVTVGCVSSPFLFFQTSRLTERTTTVAGRRRCCEIQTREENEMEECWEWIVLGRKINQDPPFFTDCSSWSCTSNETLPTNEIFCPGEQSRENVHPASSNYSIPSWIALKP